jgi:hypothetical protein
MNLQSRFEQLYEALQTQIMLPPGSAAIVCLPQEENTTRTQDVQNMTGSVRQCL